MHLNEHQGNNQQTLPGIKHLKKIPGKFQKTKSFHDGLALGGSVYVWRPELDQTLHLKKGPNNGIVWAADAISAYDGTPKTLNTLLDWHGTGYGCWESIETKIPHALTLGAVPDFNPKTNEGTDNSLVFTILLSSFPKSQATGPYNFLVKHAIKPKRKFHFLCKDALICQRNRNEPLFDLNKCSGSVIRYGTYTNNASIDEYNIENARLIYSAKHVENIVIYNSIIRKTFHQGINFNKSSKKISIIKCHIEETARDGVFLLNSVDSIVTQSTFINTGDDSIAFAGESYNATASLNTIIGAGSYNLGGSGIRFNRSGLAAQNSITNSELFGIIAADNSINKISRPEGLKLFKNKIKGIKKKYTVTGGIGFKNVIDVDCIDNIIDLEDKNAHAYRIYGERKSGIIKILGGQVSNAKSVVYIRDEGALQLSISNVKAKKIDDFILSESEGDISVISIINNTTVEAINSSLLRTADGNKNKPRRIISIISRNNKSIRTSSKGFSIGEHNEISILESINDSNNAHPVSIEADSNRILNIFISK